MRKVATIILVLTGLFFVCPGMSEAQGVDLLGVMFKLQGMRDEAAADIRRYESEIQRCNTIIMKAEQIMSLAQQKGNLEAEKVAREALLDAEDARKKNRELKDRAESRKKKADTAYAHVYNLMASQTSTNSQVKSVVTSSSGNAFILSKRLNQTIPLGDDRAGFLEPGDEIWTLGNSSAELKFLDGRGALKLGEYSKITMEEEDKGQQVINMLKGKIHIAVDKLDDHRKMMEEKIRQYKSDTTLVKDEAISKMVDEYEKLQGRMEKARKGGYHPQSPLSLWPLLPAPLVRTPAAVCAVRGTKFLVTEDETKGTDIIVLEGIVDVKAIKGGESIPVDAGYSVRATKDGVISKPEKIDLKKIKRWWEK